LRRFKVEWALCAAQDLEEIASWIAQDSTRAAERVLGRLRDKARSLESFPRRGRLVPELTLLGIHSYRELVVHPYRIIYRIDGKKVLVLAALDGRRDFSEVILRRLVRG